MLRDFNYNEEYGYVYNTFALNHVTAFGETVMELLPAGVTIPTFSDEDVKRKLCVWFLRCGM